MRSYLIRPGDTLSQLAARFGTSVSALAKLNDIRNPDLIYAGATLRLPDSYASPRPSAPGAVNEPSPTRALPSRPEGVDPVEAPRGDTSGISVDELRRVMPNLSPELAQRYLPYLNAAMNEAGITTPARRSAFLAQLAHESGELRYMEEIASGADYEGRRDLGNTEPGDGRRYKGRGPIQLTGRANYRAAGEALGIDLEGNPERAADPDVAFRIATWYWQTRGLNTLADQGNFREITRRINGGYNGMDDRERYYQRAREVF
ncbi:MAG: LysM peptidoglycan-binding domain-containing protein [Myxococcaceae bacterium]|jgi:predicted chitinase|nr:LysM peptidoglycan-binding domain-containing protein [Myxococcaceae bacterium]MCA3016833.1 LysM peptidoglycan-binding domain-containing protein [Myxococcaceae bacterium]